MWLQSLLSFFPVHSARDVDELSKTEKYGKIAKLFVAEYTKRKTTELFEALARDVRKECEDLLNKENIKGVVTCRCKSPKSLEEKMNDEDERDKFIQFLGLTKGPAQAEDKLVRKLYEHADMSDLAGVRIGVFLPGDIYKVAEILCRAFTVVHNFGTVRDLSRVPSIERNESIERHGNGPWLQNLGYSEDTWQHYGYKSWQMVIQWQRAGWSLEAAAFSNLFSPFRVEIQLGTVLTQAWAEVQHNIIYKCPSEIEVTDNMKRMIDATNGLSISADILLVELDKIHKQAEYEVNKDFLSRLWKGCQFGNERVIQDIQSARINLGVKDEHGNTALHFACIGGNTEIVANLLDVLDQDDVHVQNALGDTALHLACTEGNVEIAEKLLALGNRANFSLQNRRGETALHLACKKGNLETVERLLAVMDPDAANLQNETGETPLRLAVRAGSADIVAKLLDRLDIDDVRSQDKRGDTVLHLACIMNDGEVVRELIPRFGRDHLKIKGAKRLTAFREACQLGSNRAVREFSGWVDDDDLVAPNSSRQTALHVAAKLNLVSVVEDFLLKARACVDAQDQEQNTALHYACEQGNAYIVKALLDVKAQIDLRNVSGQTPCDAAERNQHFDIARQLQSEVRRRHRQRSSGQTEDARL
ncbi:Ankyrin repeat-containing domain protein [Beauveria brongniartii RCEF 3172]|uniref:Ankyrin repeat-containing domain protein n=1 Tax=Beauveria brongniartii RCEF 3172 TaxID=1081107 RepID=A0A167JXE4_9HYPO|nr:Ankyrin repeat-containing domain protein [Beauveria brongniartii RCEF 3172]